MIACNRNPVDNFGTVVGENPTPYGILALRAVNSLSIVCWEVAFFLIPFTQISGRELTLDFFFYFQRLKRQQEEHYPVIRYNF